MLSQCGCLYTRAATATHLDAKVDPALVDGQAAVLLEELVRAQQELRHHESVPGILVRHELDQVAQVARPAHGLGPVPGGGGGLETQTVCNTVAVKMEHPVGSR